MSRVLHIFGCMQRGGAEIRTVSLIESMKKEDIAYDFLVLSGKEGVLDEHIRHLGSTVHYCSLGKGFIKRFIAIAKQYDVIHSHVAYVSGYILMLAWFAGVTGRIAHFRNTTDGVPQTLFRRIRNRFLRLLINRFGTYRLGVCKAALTGFLGEDWRKGANNRVVYNGIDIPSVSSVARTGQSLSIIHIARMDPAKNHLRVVQIFAALSKRHPSAKLVFVGKETESVKKALVDFCAINQLSERVRFLGLRDDVPMLLQESDVLLFPSLWEGLPGVVLEALSCGVPVVASDLPGVEEIAEYCPSVLPLSLDHANEVWAQRLIRHIQDSPSRDKVVEEISHSPFLIQHNVKQLIEIYRNAS